MPEGFHTLVVRASPRAVWEFVREMENWARLLPGFQGLVKIDDRESLWTVRGDLGVVSRVVEFRVHITESIEPSKVCFRLQGTNENVTGGGTFRAASASDSSATLEFQLALEAGGTMGAMVNALMVPVLPRLVAGFAETIGREIEKQYREPRARGETSSP